MLTRQAVLDLVKPSRLALLHATVGEVLASGGTDSPRMVRQLAYHFARASALGYGGKAAGYLVLSAPRRRAEPGVRGRRRYVRAGGRPDGRPGTGSRGAAARCRSQLRPRRRLHQREECVSAAQRLWRPPHPAPAAVGYEDAAWRPGRPGADACALLTHALDDVPADPADTGYVWALASLGRAMSFTADADQARAVGEEALAHARKLGDERLLIHALQTMLWHSVVPGGIGRWTAIGDELARLARGQW